MKLEVPPWLEARLPPFVQAVDLLWYWDTIIIVICLVVPLWVAVWRAPPHQPPAYLNSDW